MNSLKKLAVAWLFMWTLSYFAVAILSPQIAGDVKVGVILYDGLGVSLFMALVFYTIPRGKSKTVARIMFLILGIVEVYGGVASWTGAATWNVPFQNKELFQVSMAFANLISAAFMFYLMMEKEE